MKIPTILGFAFLALVTPHATAARPHEAVTHSTQNVCGIDRYRNVSGNCIHRPVRSNTIPLGATARCGDGTYSFSQHRRGTCSYHGGVAQWL